MKPVALMAYPIQNSCMSNCIVLDPFLGSGSTLIACEETDRICYTTELDPRYASVIVERFRLHENGDTSRIRCLRNGKELTYEEAYREANPQEESL